MVERAPVKRLVGGSNPSSPAITVASVLWMGEFRGRGYSPEWVRRLRNMVARNLSIPHRFVCLSNVDVDGVDTIPLTEGWPGWFAKMELFKHDFGRTLYLDLDTLIVGSLDEIAEYPASFATCPPSYKFTGGQPAGGPGVVDRYQSSCMAWDRDLYGVYKRFATDPDGCMMAYRGDQDALSDWVTDGETLPPEWFNKLKHRQSGPRGEKVILSMPWKNPEAAKRFDWVREVWQ